MPRCDINDCRVKTQSSDRQMKFSDMELEVLVEEANIVELRQRKTIWVRPYGSAPPVLSKQLAFQITKCALPNIAHANIGQIISDLFWIGRV